MSYKHNNAHVVDKHCKLDLYITNFSPAQYTDELFTVSRPMT